MPLSSEGWLQQHRLWSSTPSPGVGGGGGLEALLGTPAPLVVEEMLHGHRRMDL
jgi:hypothetical protein